MKQNLFYNVMRNFNICLKSLKYYIFLQGEHTKIISKILLDYVKLDLLK